MMAKTDRQNPAYGLPLWMHARDTAGVMLYLWEKWLPDSMAAITGLRRQELRPLLIFLAAMHDVGKISNAFVCQIADILPDILLRLEPLQITRRGHEAYRHHTIVGAAIVSSLGVPDWIASVVGAHHGTIMEPMDFDDVMRPGYAYGATADVPAWQAVWQEQLDDALAQAGYASLDALPADMTQPAQMLLIALLIVADWLASNTVLFPLVELERTLTEAVYPQRVQQAIQRAEEHNLLFTRWEPDDTWQFADLCAERFGYPAANAVQQAVAQAAAQAERPGLLILEAPMGGGKTEAALMASEILAARQHQNGLAFFLPSQATTNAMFGRIMPWIRCFTDKAQSWVEEDDTAGSSGQLAVSLAHGKAMLNEQFSELSEASTDADGADGIITNGFFMGRKTKLLANFVVGTVDQLLMGALNQKHLMLRHLGLAEKVVVVDEIHAYDAYMTRYMKAMLDWLGAYRTPVILLSATLPGQRRAELVGAYLGQEDFPERPLLESERAYPLLTWTDGGAVHTQTLPLDMGQTPVQLLRGQDADMVDFLRKRLAHGGCAGVIVNTVKRAQQLARQLESTFPQAEIMLDHAQFLMPDRLEREKRLLTRLGRASTRDQRDGLIVVGTQVMEQSLDVDFDVLVSDLCPMDLLLQRLGRLHRHPRAERPIREASCLVLHGDGEELEPGAKAIYGEYLLKRTAALLPDTLHLPGDIARLVQETYQPLQKETAANQTDMDKAYSAYRERSDHQERNADKNCIPKAKRVLGRRKTTRLIDGLMNRRIDQSEAQAQASVRDGVASLEVLVLQYGADGMLHPAAQADEGFSVSQRVMPSMEEAKAIMRQSLRLPYGFSLPGRMEQVLDELETLRQTTLREWAQSPSIGRELFLLLDRNGCATLAGQPVRYDTRYGFIVEKEDSDGGKSV
ncbi:MAG: CRISPR-associated helicase Cas3' [Aristaeellaceae bacterium]